MRPLARFWSRIASLGAVVGACSCTAMILATVAGITGVLGASVSLILPDPVNLLLNATAQPLLVASLVLIVFGAMSVASRVPLILALAGTPLTYAGMFGIPGSVSITGGHAVHADPLPLAVFWLGVAPLVASVAWVRRQGPGLLPRVRGVGRILLGRLIVAGFLVGLLVVVPSAALSAFPSAMPPETAAPEATTTPLRTVKTDQDAFLWTGRVSKYSNQENYFPRFTTGKATVTVGHGITAGVLTIGVMDGVGAWILQDKTIAADDRVSVSFSTQEGRAGVWMIILDFRGVSGTVEVSVTALKG